MLHCTVTSASAESEVLTVDATCAKGRVHLRLPVTLTDDTLWVRGARFVVSNDGGVALIEDAFVAMRGCVMTRTSEAVTLSHGGILVSLPAGSDVADGETVWTRIAWDAPKRETAPRRASRRHA